MSKIKLGIIICLASISLLTAMGLAMDVNKRNTINDIENNLKLKDSYITDKWSMDIPVGLKDDVYQVSKIIVYKDGQKMAELTDKLTYTLHYNMTEERDEINSTIKLQFKIKDNLFLSEYNITKDVVVEHGEWKTVATFRL